MLAVNGFKSAGLYPLNPSSVNYSRLVAESEEPLVTVSAQETSIPHPTRPIMLTPTPADTAPISTATMPSSPAHASHFECSMML